MIWLISISSVVKVSSKYHLSIIYPNVLLLGMSVTVPNAYVPLFIHSSVSKSYTISVTSSNHFAYNPGTAVARVNGTDTLFVKVGSEYQPPNEYPSLVPSLGNSSSTRPVQ